MVVTKPSNAYSRFFWWAISYLFHPLLLITLTYLILFYFHPYFVARFYDTEQHFVLFYIFSNTFFLPVLALIIMKKIGVVKSLHLKERKERTLPYFFSLMFCVVTAWQLYNSQLGTLMYKFMIGVSVLLFLLMMVNLKFKISAHAAGIAGVTALFFYFALVQGDGNMLPWLIFFIVMSGITGASRFALGAHKPHEIYYGYLLGFCSVFISVAV